MQAQAGDWLVVHSHLEARPIRRALILAVGAGGEPPYTVRWTDTDHEAVLFPGPDATIVSATEESERQREQSSRIRGMQADIRAGGHPLR